MESVGSTCILSPKTGSASTWISTVFARSESLKLIDSPPRPYAVKSSKTERLPFSVRLVTSPQALAKAVEIRASAYSRHMPSLGQALTAPEGEDHKSDVLILLAERRLDRRPVGTLRLQSNIRRPLRLQGEAPPLNRFSDKRLLESTRLGVEAGLSGRIVTAALIKAAFEICHAAGIDYNVTGGRRSMAQIFRSMCFDELEGGPYPISFGNNIPHWIFVAATRQFQARLRTAGHWYYDFFSCTEHPDIDLDWAHVFTVLSYPPTAAQAPMTDAGLIA